MAILTIMKNLSKLNKPIQHLEINVKEKTMITLSIQVSTVTMTIITIKKHHKELTQVHTKKDKDNLCGRFLKEVILVFSFLLHMLIWHTL